MIHFTQSSYERAPRLPTSSPISGLVRLGVKPRLCRSFWKAFAPLTQLMLPPTSPREALLVCPQSPPWNLPSFTVESTLSSVCSRPDPSLSLAKVRPSLILTLPPYNLVLWTDRSVPFPFGKGGSGVPANYFLALKPLFPFQQARYAQVFPLKPAPFCTLFAGLSSTNKSIISLLLLSKHRSVLFSIFSFTAISLADLAGTVFSLLQYYEATVGPRILISPRGMTWLMSWPDGERYSHPLQSLVVSLLLSLVSTLIFSRTGGVLSHLNSSTHRFPRFPLRNLCSLVTLAVFSLVFAATDTAYC